MSDKQQLAAMGEHMAEHMAGQAEQPLCMAKRIEELEAQLAEKIIKVERLREMNLIAMKRVDGMLDRNLELSRLQSLMAEGWRLVPHMPTPEMCAAFHKSDADWEDGWAFDDNGNRHDSPVYQWVAMLAAAPSPDSDK